MAFGFNLAAAIGGFVDQSNKVKEQQQKDSQLAIAKAAQGDKHALNQAHINYYNALANAKGDGRISAKDQSIIDRRYAGIRDSAARSKMLQEEHDAKMNGTWNPGGKPPKGPGALDDAPNRADDARGDGPGPAIGGMSKIPDRAWPGSATGGGAPDQGANDDEATPEDIQTAQDAADDEDEDANDE